MANITSPQVISLWNAHARPLADLIERCRRTCEAFVVDAVAIEAVIGGSGAGNANGDVIVDGAATDGRSICTKQNFLELKFVAEQIAAAANQDDREQLIHNIVVNGAPLY